MAESPAVLITDDLVEQLNKSSICQVSFQELSGTLYPWEVDLKTFQEIKAKLDHIEKSIRAANPEVDISCVLTGQGAFWQPREGLESFINKMQDSKKNSDQEGPSPIWRLISSEILTGHISNMRQLIMAAAHDHVLLTNLKDPLGNNHMMLQREFDQGERHVRMMLDDIFEQGGNLEFATSENIMMLERVRVTQDMLERGVVSEEQLGYSIQELQRVKAVLERRCAEEFPKFRQRMQATFNQAKDSLRNGECTQLRRVSHWEMAFALMGVPPVGYRGQSELVSTERETVSAVVASREEEIGESEAGKIALAVAEESRNAVEPHKSSPPTNEPPEEPAEQPVEEAPQPKKIVKPRMAIMDRIRR